MATVNDGIGGVASVDVTPPIGIPLIGFRGRGPATDIHDGLRATALVLRSGFPRAESLALVACDLVGMDERLVGRIQAGARTATGIANLQVLLNCSHTHYGPEGPTSDGQGQFPDERVRAYTELLVHDVIGAISLATSRARPCRIRVAIGNSSIGINRRERSRGGSIVLGQNPGGPCDDRVVVLSVEDNQDRRLASVVNFACHPVCLGSEGPESRSIGRDFVGAMTDLVEQYTGAPCLFLQGAAGNINPRVMSRGDMRRGQTGVLETALPLAAEVVRLLLAGEFAGSDHEAISISFASASVEYPRKGFKTMEDGESAVSELQAERNALAKRSGEDCQEELQWVELRLNRAELALGAARGDGPLEPVRAQQCAVTLTRTISIATVPCELFTELGQGIIAGSPFRTTMVAAYTNGYIGYVPTSAAYDEGGYEVTHGALVDQGSGEDMVEKALDLLRQLEPGLPTQPGQTRHLGPH